MTDTRRSMTRFLVPALAACGIVIMIYTVLAGEKEYPVAPPANVPASSPFKNTVAGSGLVEAAGQNIAIGSPLPGTVAEVAVKVGDKVEAGAVLFALDNRHVLAELATREAALKVAQRRVPEARSLNAEAEFQLAQVRGLEDNRAVSREEIRRRETLFAATQARLASAEAGVTQAEAERAATRVELDRLIVRAPAAGEILQVNARLGEYIAPGGAPAAPVVMGDTRVLHVRVDIDENETWRLRPGAAARGTLKGNSALSTPLTWVRTEPLAIPKKSLTGASSERVDTRVLQVIFAFDPSTLPIHVGQQMDVFIDAGGQS